MMMGANLALVLMVVLFVVGLVMMAFNDAVLDFVKANFGLVVLLLLFFTLFAVAFHVFHENANPNSKDFLAWIEQKGGEVLASIMTMIVGVRAANSRASDSKTTNGNGNGATIPTPGATHQ